MKNSNHRIGARLREEQYWLLTGGVLLLTFIAFSFALYFTRMFMIPFVFSIFITAMVSPIDNLIVVRFNLPRWVGLACSFSIILFLVFLLIFLVRFAAIQLTDTIRSFDISAEQFMDKTGDMISYFGVPKEYVDADKLLEPIKQEGPAYLKATASMFQSFISCGTLVLLFCLFILMGHNPKIREKNEIYSEIERSIQKYLNIKFFISLATGLAIYILFLCLGVPMAFLFGILTFVLNFIPSIGSIIATFLPMPVVLITEGFTPTGIALAFFVPVLIQNLMGNIIEPNLQGQGLNLHPVSILLALGYFGVVWGPVGMLLAAPMTAALRIILLEFKMTKWIALIMEGKLPQFERAMDFEMEDV
ncbi:MAG: AI-2E family transporter [Planctomycetia bacterium]|nr:AI-2E family transporter [Planctomycetia bacterium]